jgi:hypothetical protein
MVEYFVLIFYFLYLSLLIVSATYKANKYLNKKYKRNGLRLIKK